MATLIGLRVLVWWSGWSLAIIDVGTVGALGACARKVLQQTKKSPFHLENAPFFLKEKVTWKCQVKVDVCWR